MVECCCKCGETSDKDKNITLFSIPISCQNIEWKTEFINRLGVVTFQDQIVNVCNKHFRSDDIVISNGIVQLKKNALPLENDEVEEQLEIQPEIIFLRCEANGSEQDSNSDSGEAKEFVPLEPLVEYNYEGSYEKVVDSEGREYIIQETCNIEDVGGEHEVGFDGVIQEYEIEEDNPEMVSVVSSEGNNVGTETVMPFFLTSSPVFTILNENNEDEDTIILQIEEPKTKKEQASLKDPNVDPEKFFCPSTSDTTGSGFACDICSNSYGCLNCLKSHYKTFHVCTSPHVKIYKCKYSSHISKTLVCPVCELTFENRSDTMDHYITHSVGCEFCGCGFDRQSYLNDHYRSVHSKSEFEIKYDCTLCGALYQHISHLRNHYRYLHKIILCCICMTKCTTMKELQEHEKVHRRLYGILPYACSKCDKAFSEISDIAVHIRQDHKVQSAAGQRVNKQANIEQFQMTCDSEDAQPSQKKVKMK